MYSAAKIKESFVLCRILAPIFFIGLSVMSIIVTQKFTDKIRKQFKRACGSRG